MEAVGEAEAAAVDSAAGELCFRPLGGVQDNVVADDDDASGGGAAERGGRSSSTVERSSRGVCRCRC